jgi:hypothetical protein
MLRRRAPSVNSTQLHTDQSTVKSMTGHRSDSSEQSGIEFSPWVIEHIGNVLYAREAETDGNSID